MRKNPTEVRKEKFNPPFVCQVYFFFFCVHENTTYKKLYHDMSTNHCERIKRTYTILCVPIFFNQVALGTSDKNRVFLIRYTLPSVLFASPNHRLLRVPLGTSDLVVSNVNNWVVM